MPASDLISKKTRYEFREEMVGMVLREIEQLFNQADLEADSTYQPPTSGQRRSFVEQFYKSIDFTNPEHVRKLLKVYAAIIEGRERYPNSHPDPRQAKDRTEYLKKCLLKDGYEYVDAEFRPTTSSPAVAHAKVIAVKFDMAELRRLVNLIDQHVEPDPRLAIGTSKELVETVAKTILENRGTQPNPKWDLSRLVGEARALLKLLPEDIDENAPGADRFRGLLSSLATVVSSLGEIRTKWGSGHGAAPSQKGLKPRHARLVAGAACALAIFLWETHLARPPQA